MVSVIVSCTFDAESVTFTATFLANVLAERSIPPYVPEDGEVDTAFFNPSISSPPAPVPSPRIELATVLRSRLVAASIFASTKSSSSASPR